VVSAAFLLGASAVAKADFAGWQDDPASDYQCQIDYDEETQNAPQEPVDVATPAQTVTTPVVEPTPVVTVTTPNEEVEPTPIVEPN